MKCENCGSSIEDGEGYQHAGKNLCEDCYLDLMTVPKTCDPWAVHSAKNTPGQQAALTEIQQQLLDLIRSRGPLKLEEIISALNLDENEFRRNFATLRHMELARGSKEGDQVLYRVFEE